MDSMRQLNTSLPTPYTSRPVPPEHLLQAFKSAALSVTNLYKSAVQDQNNNRAAGYQDALDDLVRFLDSENLGLQDGEGWRVRQWLTERYDGTANQPQAESDDEKVELAPVNISTPVDRQNTESEATSEQHPEAQAVPEDDIMQQNRAARQRNQDLESESDHQSSFHFRYPSESAVRLQEERESLSAPPLSSPVSDNDMSESQPSRMSVSRGHRPYRSVVTRQPTRGLGIGAGTKRKSPVSEINFFDVGNFGNGPRDGSDPSAKRGRHA